jgi:hypothetical protein
MVNIHIKQNHTNNEYSYEQQIFRSTLNIHMDKSIYNLYEYLLFIQVFVIYMNIYIEMCIIN